MQLLTNISMAVRIVEEAGRLSFFVPRRQAERLQGYLRKCGIRSTVCWDVWAEEARLEPWPDAGTTTALRSFVAGLPTAARN
jgi:hypothetical protein